LLGVKITEWDGWRAFDLIAERDKRIAEAGEATLESNVRRGSVTDWRKSLAVTQKRYLGEGQPPDISVSVERDRQRERISGPRLIRRELRRIELERADSPGKSGKLPFF